MRKALFPCSLSIMLLAACNNSTQTTYGSFTQQIQAANQESRELAESVTSSLSTSFTTQSFHPLGIPESSQTALIKLRQNVIARFPNIIKQTVWLSESAQLVAQSDKTNITKDLIGMYVIVTSDSDVRFRQVWVATITANLRTKEVLNTSIAPDLKSEYIAASDRYQDASGKWPMFRFLVVGDPSKTNPDQIRQMSLGQLPTPVNYIQTAGFNEDGSVREAANQ